MVSLIPAILTSSPPCLCFGVFYFGLRSFRESVFDAPSPFWGSTGSVSSCSGANVAGGSGSNGSAANADGGGVSLRGGGGCAGGVWRAAAGEGWGSGVWGVGANSMPSSESDWICFSDCDGARGACGLGRGPVGGLSVPEGRGGAGFRVSGAVGIGSPLIIPLQRFISSSTTYRGLA